MSIDDINKLSRVQLRDGVPRERFVVDTVELSSQPHVIQRKLSYELINLLNSTAEYKNYAIVLQSLQTVNPQTTTNKIISLTNQVSSGQTTEYLVIPIDKAGMFFSSNGPLLMMKMSVRCSSKVGSLIPPNSLVEIEYIDDKRQEAIISFLHGELPPGWFEEKQKAVGNISKVEPCQDTVKVYTPTVAIGTSPAASSVNQSAPPMPVMSCVSPASCENIVKTSADSDKISKYYTIKELTTTSTGIENIPDKEQEQNLKNLALNILDKLADKYKKDNVTLNSVFRSDAVNKQVGGANNSQHKLGSAADFIIKDKTSHEDVLRIFEEIISMKLPFDQLILESTGKGSFWYHISISSNPRGQKLSYGPWTMAAGKKQYMRYDKTKIDLYYDSGNFDTTEQA